MYTRSTYFLSTTTYVYTMCMMDSYHYICKQYYHFNVWLVLVGSALRMIYRLLRICGAGMMGTIMVFQSLVANSITLDCNTITKLLQYYCN